MSIARAHDVVRFWAAFIALTLGASPYVASQGRAGMPAAVLADGHEAVDGEVLVRFLAPPAEAELRQLRAQLDLDADEVVAAGAVYRFHSRSYRVEPLINYLRTRSDVAYAEPNHIVRLAETLPNDPTFGSLWGLRNTGQSVANLTNGVTGADTKAANIWDYTTGSTAVAVAVIDSGIDYTHADLNPNTWSAAAAYTVTIAGKSVSCAAGTRGYNTLAKTCTPLDDSLNSHGTHVAGTIGARGNDGYGVSGMNWTTRMVAVKAFDSSGAATTTSLVNAIDYATQLKTRGIVNVRVINASWVSSAFAQSLMDAIGRANTAGILFVAAAGNNASNNDATAVYPANYDVANIVSVAATDNSDTLASFSNYGAAQVDLAAPGVAVLSTVRSGAHGFKDGTSMATPHVAGAAALVLSLCSYDTVTLRSALLAGVDKVAGLTGVVASGGRLNALKAASGCLPTSAPATPVSVTATAGNGQVTVSWAASAGAASYDVYSGTSETSISTLVGSTGSTSFVHAGLVNGTRYYYRVVARNAVGASAPSASVSAVPVAPPGVPTGLSAVGGPNKGQVTVSWAGVATAATYTVKRATSATGTYSVVGTVSAPTTTFVNSSLRSGTVYYYKVAASNAGGTSADSSAVSAAAR